MEDNFFEEIKVELEHDVEGKSKWLEDVIKKTEELSLEFSSLSFHLQNFFSALVNSSNLIADITSIFTFPEFFKSAALNFSSLVDEKLSIKYQELSALVAKWNKRLRNSLKLYETRSHCKYLFEKILLESSKITQDHRLKEMEIIKEEYWSSYLIKHKEFQLSLSDLQSSGRIYLVGPLSEHVLLTSQYLSEFYSAFQSLESQARLTLNELRTKDYPVRLEFNQKSLKVFKDKESIFRYIRKKITEGNSFIQKKFEPNGAGELKVEAGERFVLRAGDFHQNWAKGISFNGEKGFIPKACVNRLRFAQVFEEHDRVYKIQPFEDQAFLQGVQKHLISIKILIDSYSKLPQNLRKEGNLVILMRNLVESVSVNKIFMNSLEEHSENIEDFLVFLPLYTDSYDLCLKILKKSEEKLALSPFLCSISQELVRSNQKTFINLLQKYLYSKYSKDQSTSLNEIVEIISLASWRLTKSLKTAPNEKELISYLEDPKQKPIKRLTNQQNSLIIFDNFIIFASAPLKVQKIVSFDDVLEVSSNEETLEIYTKHKTLSFKTENSKKAAEWVLEIENLVDRPQIFCGICGEVNIVKVVAPCFRCGRLVCWLCECLHS